MTRYKNPFEDPDADFYGKKVKDYKIPERRETPLEKKAAKYPEIEDYIYVPKIKLYVAKEKSLHGLKWDQAHKELHKQGLQMLTIRQFIDFILYLKQNKSNVPEAENILDEIFNGDCGEAELLDAKFTKEEGRLFIHYNHKATKGKLVAKNIEPLEKCLMKSCDIDLRSCNRQGLPTEEGKDIHYFYPRGDSIAGFDTEQDNVHLDCNWDNWDDLEGAYRGIGVRAAFKIGGKKQNEKTIQKSV